MLKGVLRRSQKALAVSLRDTGVETWESHNYRALLAQGAWFGLIDGGIFTYLPVFLARLGASASVIGLLTSGPSLVGIVSYIPGGIYAERQANLVKLVAVTSFISRLAYPLIALLPFFLAPSAIPLTVAVLWSLAAIPSGIWLPAWIAVIQKAVSAERQARLNGTRWALLSAVSAVAITSFGYMLDRVPFPQGYQIVFLISFAGALLTTYYWMQVRVPAFVPERNDPPGHTDLSARARAFLRPLVESQPFLRYNLATLLYRLALNMPVALFSIFWVEDLRATDTWIGLRGSVGYVALIVGYVFWGRMANRLGHRNMLLICGSLLGLYPVCTALVPTMQWLLPVAVLWGFTIGAVDIGLFDMLLAVCPEGRQPTFAATANMLISVVVFVAPFLGAALAEAVGVRAALLISGGLQVASAALFLLLPSREQEGLGPLACRSEGR